MGDVHIDLNTFHKRLSIIQRHLVQDKLKQVIIIVGAPDDENTYKKSNVIQNWLLGYEFTHTLIYVSEDKCIFITSEGKSKYLTHLPNKPSQNSSDVDIWIRTKDIEKNKSLFVKLIEQIKQVDSQYGIVIKDQYKGKFIDEWTDQLKLVKDELTAIDISLLISKSIEIKDSEEFSNVSTAANASIVMLDTFTNEMMTIVDEERKITNSKLTDQIEDKIENNNWYKKSKLSNKLKNFDPELLEWCYSPIIQSGGDYDLKPSAISTNKQLIGDGIILASIGLRYKSYCSNIARTFLIDPTPEMESNYDFLLQLQDHIVKNLLKQGKLANEVYQGSIEFIKQNRPELVSNFTKNCGWLIGIEFRDSTFILNAKNDRKLQNGQIFSITIGFNNLNIKGKSYAVLLSDTYKVTESEAILLTDYSKQRSEVSFFFKDDNNNIMPNNSIKPEKKIGIEIDNGKSKILKSKLRHESASNEDDANAEKLRQENQVKLHERRQQEGLARFSKADATDSSDFKPVFKKYESYIRESQIPNTVRDLKIHVDYKNQTIILPICGRPVPFHINSFKNGSSNEEGDYTYLRLNFNSPGAGGNVSKRTELPYEDNPDNSFLRSITLRSKDRQRMIDVFKAIQELKKDSVKRESERKQMADVVTQANLIELKGSRVKKLDNVSIRPQPDNKRVAGVLEIHENGLRYQSSFKSDQRVDVLFSNIKHLFFQPCRDELIVLIHCHLKNPIMVGKRKTFDVQFYREASDMAFDETGGRKRKYRYGDEDELQQEQEERRRKLLLDKEFKAFAELIADSSHGILDLDIPFRELGFQGVPFRSSVFCMPTRDCLVQLIDPPYLVVTLEEIEVAHLERVQFGLKNFDMVFVFKDFSKPVVHINTIPMELLEDVKSWLTDVDIPLSEGQVNLNWITFMKAVQSDPYQFFADGGWSCLTGYGESDDEDEEDQESEFEVSDEDPDDESAVSEDDDEEDDYASDSGSGSDFSGDEEEDGEDWDEMERKAAKEDSRRFRE
ncbi:global regulator of transcription [Scheffersomyces amazonensis]|uniref:global regulator of transcription n=1 Tax=Scheffersomyces amazonensis TaxID=1078765 RepID=UPI00315C7AFC